MRRDLVEAELLVIVGTDPFGGVDLNKVKIDIPQIELPPLDFNEPPKSK
jgi:hypothetical protein